MLCNWSTTANTILYGIVHRNANSLILWRKRSTSITSLLLGSCGTLRLASHSRPIVKTHVFPSPPHTVRRTFASAACQTPDSTLQSPPPHEQQADFWALRLTTAETSRAAAQAVRLCVRDGKYGNALYLVNSLHLSVYPGNPDLLRRHAQAKGGPAPIDFGRPISPRLSAHAFLHGLLRGGHHSKAAKYAMFMMSQGIRVRPTTTNSIISALTSDLGERFNLRRMGHALSLRRPNMGSTVLRLDSSHLKDPCTRVAVQLLETARKWGQQRSIKMWERVINTCLMQGEIIVASLLFVLLVKDLQLRNALSEKARQTDCNAEALVDPPPSTSLPSPMPQHVFAQFSPGPHPELLNRIVNTIQVKLSPDLQGSDNPRFIPLQALANLALLLDTGQLPTKCTNQVIHALYSCPKAVCARIYVWVRDDRDKPTAVAPYPYFQKVLIRLIRSLRKDNPYRPAPRLDLRSYNSLLFYSLRHRLSPKLASTVLNHMCLQRQPPLKPNIVTYNILLRSGTLLRKNPISGEVLTILRNRKANLKHGVMVEPPSDRMQQVDIATSIGERSCDSQSTESSFARTLRCLLEDDLRMPPGLLHPPVDIQADEFTLSSYIAHLASSGVPATVADVLFYVMPELRIVDHPSWGSLTLDQRKQVKRRSREICLQRAVRLGPRVFGSTINALMKAGRLGLAERVWLLAKQAEAASWKRDFVPEVAPWCLSTHAYTSMLQCYAVEARRCITRMRSARENMNLYEEGRDWQPVSTPVAGWARFVYAARKANINPTRRRTSWGRTELFLYQCMRSGGLAVYRSLTTVVSTGPVDARPRLDARFFNAALALFGRHPYMQPRAQYRRGALRRRAPRLISPRNSIREKRSPLWTPALQEVADGMAVAGFPVPVGFRHVLGGIWGLTPSSSKRLRKLPSDRPSTFPQVHLKHSAFALPTMKTRGLPLRSRRKRRTSARWVESQRPM